MDQQMLSRKQFHILTYLEKCVSEPTQRIIADATGISLGSVNRTLSELTGNGYICANRVTEKGFEALEPYRVKRAVFLAAGFGHRMIPISLNTPKPLVRVKGVRIIDTLLDAVLAAGIQEIYIVRGYLSEQFDQLLTKYPMVRFIENPRYIEAENIYSALCARDFLQNTYVLESDLVLHNPGLITKYQYTSNYLAVPTEKTDDWCFDVKGNTISAVHVGGTNCFHMYGISYWNAADGAKLSNDLAGVYETPGGKERYWDQVPLEYCKSHYQVEIRPCSFADISEVDTLSDLRKLDPSYCY